MLYYSGLILISAATILLELTLLRLFAVQQFYHFAFMAVSLALLGAGAGGSILSVWPRRWSPALLSLAFAITTFLAYLIINYLPFDSFSIAWDSRQVLYLAIYFLATAVPFLFAGLLVGGELMAASANSLPTGRHSNQVYGANLIGSAAGSLVSLLVLNAVGGAGAVTATVLLASVSGFLFGLAARPFGPVRKVNRLLTFGAGLLILVSLLALLRAPDALAQRLSPYKTLSVLGQAFDAQHTVTRWDAAARVDVIESSTLHVMPGLSLLSPVQVPPQAGLMLDGDNLMPISNLDPASAEAGALVNNVPGGLAYHLRPQPDVLVIEAGTGMDVLLALAAGAERVTAVEENALIIDLMTNEYREFSHGLYERQEVEVVNQSGRVFARQGGTAGQGQYDVLVVSLTDPHRPVTSGAYSLTEDYLYTVEAFIDYLRLLGPDGLLVTTRWLQTPPSESARLFAGIAGALDELGGNPADQLLAFRTLRTMTVVASRQPFTNLELEAARAFLAGRNYDAVYYPGISDGDLNRYNLLGEPVYHDLFQQVLADPAGTYDDYRFDIRPSTDNRPFFYNFFKWQQTPEIMAGLGLTWQPFGGSGYFVLVALLILVSLASAVLIIGPLLLKRRRSSTSPMVPVQSWRWRVFLYFACLGLAFLFVEIPIAQRFILVLDKPVTALAVVLFALLLFSGLGSLTVGRWSMPWALLLLIFLIAAYPALLTPVSDLALSQPAWGRIVLVVLALAPIGFLMGLPFAGGLRVVERREPGLVPWAWAINGSFSVISSVLAVMIALSWGFSAVLWLGAAAYGLALLAFRGLWNGQSVAEVTK
jgi:spermidine synthase